MSAWSRLPMLARLAFRYSRRHRVQTVRAVLGLVVISLVLTTGLGLGDSLGASLESAIEERFGPVEVIVRGPPEFNDTLAADLVADVAIAPLGVRGITTLAVVGSIADTATGKAEAFATIRGVHPGEPAALGPLGAGVAEPVGDGVVLSKALADRIGASVGDAVQLRALPTDLDETFGIDTTRDDGTLPAGGTRNVPFKVKDGALGVLANVGLEEGARATVELRSPTGQSYPAVPSPSGFGFDVRALAPLAPGGWNLTIGAAADLQYNATVRVGYTPPAIEEIVVLLNATVTGIVPTEGRAAVSARPMAMLPLARLQAALGMQGMANQAYFTADGDPVSVALRMEGILGNDTWDVDATKAEAIERVRRDAGNISGFILVMGGFTIVASMLLAYVLFSSLVEERRVELGIARAVGLTRREVATTMILEALVYAVLAAAVGVLIGLALVQGFVTLINGYAAQFRAPEFFLHLEPLTLPIAFLGGALLPIATIAVGTARFARLDPARAIRGAPEDVRVHRASTAIAGVLLLAAGLLMALDPLWRLVGLGIAAGGATTLLLAARRRLIAALVAAAGVAYTLWSLYSFTDFPPQSRQLDPVLTMLRALVVTLLVAALLVCSPRPARAASRAFMLVGGLRRGAYVALRYLAARRVQAGLTASMVAVVAVVVTVMGTLAAIFAGSLERDEGGYAVVGQSPFPLTTFPQPLQGEDAAAVEAAEFLPQHRPLGNLRMTIDGDPFREGRFVRFAGVAPSFARSNGYEVQGRDARYGSDLEAWQAVADGEAVLAPPWYFDPGGLVVGGGFTVDAGGGNRTYVVAGMLPDARRGDIYMANDDVRGMGFPQAATVLVRVRPDADATALAHRLTDRFQASGLVFESVAEEVQEAEDILQATVLVMQSFLFLGLFVGISSTGFLASRAVHERRREIGTLRALGYEAKDVSRAFILESTLVAALGLLLGTAVGLVVAHAIWWRSVRTFGGDFVLPWQVLAIFAVAVLGLTALASWSPTRRAARLDPAVALRYVE